MHTASNPIHSVSGIGLHFRYFFGAVRLCGQASGYIQVTLLHPLRARTQPACHMFLFTREMRPTDPASLRDVAPSHGNLTQILILHPEFRLWLLTETRCSYACGISLLCFTSLN